MNRETIMRAYAFLLRLHPRAFRNTFGPEMQTVFARLLHEIAAQQTSRLLWFCLHEFAGLLGSLIREYWELTMHLNVRRRIALGGLLSYALPLIGLSFVVYHSSPGPFYQEILGLSLGRHDQPGGQVYISGRQLDCAPTTIDDFAERCTLEIAGTTLELLARRNGPESLMQLGGTCRASYGGETWPCRIGSRHIHVHWFAYLSDPLGLSVAELEALRRQYPLENSGEQPFLLSILIVPLSSAVIIAGVMILWFWSHRRRFQLIAASALAAAMTWFFMVILTLSVTNGFWD